jgi:A/G-specific adenine glycosylase
MMAATGSISERRRTPAAANRKTPVAFQRALLRWYDAHRRDLPWRKTRDPYRIWLSEIMLQQTRVAAVLEHYRIFLERFPSIEALASASEADVLAAWSGLGYYRRARMMRRCAQQIVDQHESSFPQNSKDLLALPGIGRYTAAAIASIAFGESVAVVDGNVERVLQRMIGGSLTIRQVWEHAQSLVDRSRPGDFNQAMMELGATVCVPREPRCIECPARKWCVTRGVEVRRAQPGVRQQKKEVWCALDWREGNAGGKGKVRLVQRPRNASLMGGMWELPQSSTPPRRSRTDAAWRKFRHSITVTSYTVHVLLNKQIGSRPLPDNRFAAKGEWIGLDRIQQLPITGLTRKILKAGGMI